MLPRHDKQPALITINGKTVSLQAKGEEILLNLELTASFPSYFNVRLEEGLRGASSTTDDQLETSEHACTEPTPRVQRASPRRLTLFNLRVRSFPPPLLQNDRLQVCEENKIHQT